MYRSNTEKYQYLSEFEDYVKEKTSEEAVKQYTDTRNKDISWQNKQQPLQM